MSVRKGGQTLQMMEVNSPCPLCHWRVLPSMIADMKVSSIPKYQLQVYYTICFYTKIKTKGEIEQAFDWINKILIRIHSSY